MGHENKMLSEINPNHTLYVVHLLIDSELSVTIGKLGVFTFPKGLYLYVGSAKKNIIARLKRHLQKEKKHRWHIDYVRPYGEIIKIETYPNEMTECELLKKLQLNVNGQLLIKGFGSSDCKCRSHFIYCSESNAKGNE